MKERTRHGSGRLPVLAAVALLAVVPVRGGESPGDDICDPGLESRSEDPRAYRLRGDRCEGIYRLKVNSDKIQVHSWTARFEDFDPEDPSPVEVTWSLPPGAQDPVRLRATALRSQTYYRMDTRLPGNEARWSWPTAFLGQLGLGRPDLGVVGWTKVAAAGADQQVYLPLGLRQNEASPSDGYRVVLVPGERVLEITWRLSPVVDGRVGAPLGDAQPIGYGYYPAREPTVFTLPAPAAPGVYVLDLQARLRTGAWAPRELWFYHPGHGAAGADVAVTGGGTP